ncbi:MAG: ATP-binding protein [Opitutaceae bacterium]|nr:ATP-binding protein [Opitutaceae bacterium]
MSLLWCVCLFVSTSRADADVADWPVTRSAAEFWNLPESVRNSGVVIEWDCAITFYDQYWNILFIQDVDGAFAYVDAGPKPLPIAAGQRVRVRNELTNAASGPSFAGAGFSPGGMARLEPITVDWAATFLDSLGAAYIRIEGVVEEVSRTDSQHLFVRMSAFGNSFILRVLDSDDEPLPQWIGRIVSVTGVYNFRPGDGRGFVSREILVASRDNIRVVSLLAEDSRFSRPVTPIGALQRANANEMVRVIGRVTGCEPNRWVILRDDTGQITVMTGQGASFQSNQPVEAIGYPQVSGTQWTLRSGVVRSREPSPVQQEAAAQGPLRVAADILDLSPDDATKGLPVDLYAVVTWSHPDAPFFFVQDSSCGVAVWRGDKALRVSPPGDLLQISGRTKMGEFSPAVIGESWHIQSVQSLPVAKKITLERALTGNEEAQWVEIEGVVRQSWKVNEGTALEVGTTTGSFKVIVVGEAPPDGWVGDIVRVQGVCEGMTDPDHRLIGVRLWVPSPRYVLVDQPAPLNVFDAPLHPLSKIGRYGTYGLNYRRVRVHGTVFMVEDSLRIHVADGPDVLTVALNEPTTLQVGDLVECVGFLNRGDGHLLLADSIVRRTGAGVLPQPANLEGDLSRDQVYNGRLVRLEGRVLDVAILPGLFRVTVQVGREVIEARLPGPAVAKPAGVDVGALVELIGKFEVQRSTVGDLMASQLRLRSLSDARVLRSPPVLTAERLVAVAGGLGLLTAASLAWVLLLRKRIRLQTDQIREQVNREAQLEADLQRATRLESLGHLAGGIAHDFNNLLTVMMGNLSIVRYDIELPAATAQALHEAELAAIRAKDLTQQLLTFAKGGAPIRSAIRLHEIVREVAEFALVGSSVKCTFVFPDGVWRANVDRGQIGQVVQNLVINAMQAMPKGGGMRIQISNTIVGSDMAPALEPGAYVVLEVSDKGTGIESAALPHIFDPYFTTKTTGSGLGLATVHSIVKRHGGHVTVESQLGKGTSFKIWLPAVQGEIEDFLPAAPTAPLVPQRTSRRIRVLFMDDEMAIRQTGAQLLGRLGYEVVTAADGAEAVRLYAEGKSQARGFDIVILDLTVPGGMGGRDALTELKKHDPDVRAIVSSGYSNDAILAEYRRHGFAGMVSKPYEITDLSHTIDRVVRGENA